MPKLLYASPYLYHDQEAYTQIEPESIRKTYESFQPIDDVPANRMMICSVEESYVTHGIGVYR
jgi:hypothetical protein